MGRVAAPLRAAETGFSTLIRSRVIGTLVGIFFLAVAPGRNAIAFARFLFLRRRRRFSKHPNDFGTGAEPGGVLATESANNATVGVRRLSSRTLGARAYPATPPDAVISCCAPSFQRHPHRSWAVFTGGRGDIVYTFKSIGPPSDPRPSLNACPVGPAGGALRLQVPSVSIPEGGAGPHTVAFPPPSSARSAIHTLDARRFSKHDARGSASSAGIAWRASASAPSPIVLRHHPRPLIAERGFASRAWL